MIEHEEYEWLNASQIAKMLGVSAMTIYRMRDKGELPFVKISGTFKCKRSDVESYLEERTVQPKDKQALD